MKTYVPLHVHSTFSLLDGLSLPEKLTKRAKTLGIPALALTDHGTLGGTMEMYGACKKEGLKFLPGVEAYFCPDASIKERAQFHLNLIAMDNEGWKNLVRMISIANLHNFYYKPRVDWKLLQEYGKGILATSACIGSVCGQAIMKGDIEGARKYISDMKDLFGDRWYVEVGDNGYPDQKIVNPVLISLAKDLGVKVVATNDLHYVEAKDASTHDALLCIQTQSFLGSPNRPFKFETSEFYLKSYDEMAKLWPEEYLANTLEVAERINVNFDTKGYDFPKFPCPDGMTDNDLLEQLCQEGWGRRMVPRLHKLTIPIEEYQKRVRYELEVIKKIGFASYFLIVHDYVEAARKAGVRVGPGRGSAAGSFVLYLLGITGLDPLAWGLLFERFMNPDRVAMPDVDIDFEDKDWVLQYLLQRWGQENCAPIGTFGRIWAKSAIRDSVRVLSLPESVAIEIGKVIPEMVSEDQAAKPASFDQLFEASAELRKMKEKYPAVFALAEGLEGAVRSTGIHASGVVIAPNGLMERVPLQIVTDREAKEKSKKTIATQYDGTTCDKIGLLKVDVLGLKTLKLISLALKNIKQSHGVDVEIPVDAPEDCTDEEAFAMLRDSQSLGIFQLEGVGMQNLLKKVGVDSVLDIVATIALFRPGPISAGLTFAYADRKHGLEFEYMHPNMKASLEETYGVVTYQEQMMFIAKDVAGWTFAQADMLRKACGKMDPKLMREQKEKFIPDCIANGCSPETAEAIWHQFEGFGVYAFNKSHSAAYGALAYQCSYLKAHYPREFMAALLTNEGDPEKSLLYLNECKRLGVINLTPPDINESDLAFVASPTALRYGLGGIKNVGDKAIIPILEARPYKSFVDFLWKHINNSTVNRRVIESLIRVGCFNSMGYNPFKLLEHLDVLRAEIKYVDELQSGKKKPRKGMPTAVDVEAWEAKFKEFDQVWSQDETLALEKEYLGVYLSGHPLDKYADVLAERGITTSSLIDDEWKGPIAVAGVVVEVKEITTKKKEPMAFVRIEDTYSTLQVILWPTAFNKYRQFCERGKLLAIKGFYRDKQVTLGDQDRIVELDKLKEGA